MKHGKLMATITKSYDPETLTLTDAVAILAAKAAKGGKPQKAAKTDAATEKKPAKSRKKAAK